MLEHGVSCPDSSPVDLCGDDGTTPCNKIPMPVDSEERFAWSGDLCKHSCGLGTDGTIYSPSSRSSSM